MNRTSKFSSSATAAAVDDDDDDDLASAAKDCAKRRPDLGVTSGTGW